MAVRLRQAESLMREVLANVGWLERSSGDEAP
jgi:hypothetical protein